MSLLEDIGTGMLGVVLLIVGFVILFVGVFGLLAFGNSVIGQILGIILIIVGCGVIIASRKRMYGH